MLRAMVTGVCAAIVGFAALMTVWPGSQMNLLDVAQAQSPQAEETTEKVFDAKPPKMSQADRENHETRKRLTQKVDFDFSEDPLNEVLPFLGKKNGIQFYFDVCAIQNIGHELDTVVSFKMKEVPIEMGLRLILQSLELSYYLDNGIIIVTSNEILQTRLSVRMYNVKDLAGNCSSNIPSTPMMNVGKVRGFSGGGMSNGSCVASMPAKPTDKGSVGGIGGATPKAEATYPMVVGVAVGGTTVSNPYRGLSSCGTTAVFTPRLFNKNNSDRLINVIKCVTNPESWAEVGGAGTIVCYRGILIVRQTESVHEEVEKLLDQLRYRLKNAPMPENPPTVFQSPYGMYTPYGNPVPMHPYATPHPYPDDEHDKCDGYDDHDGYDKHDEHDVTGASGSRSGYAPPMQGKPRR